jgi:hypothetical protein
MLLSGLNGGVAPRDPGRHTSTLDDSQLGNGAHARGAAFVVGVCTLALCAWVGCGPDASQNTPTPADASASDGPLRPAFCARMRPDAIHDALCLGAPPVIRSLHDLQDLLQIETDPLGHYAPAAPAPDGLRVPKAAVLLAHSTALPGHFVSPINPRAIIMGGSRTIMAYQRGVQRAELATLENDTGAFHFYLLSFTQACNQQADGCKPGDLYTPRVESDWTNTEIRDDEDLKDTPFDCRQCHQRNRASATLLMHELQSPWTHFFEQLAEAGTVSGGSPLPGVRGADLLRDYLQAKADEPYAGLSMDTIAHTSAFVLETTAGTQPLVFDAAMIETERFPFGPDGRSTTAQPSPTWNSAYQAFKRGEQLALPYIEPRASDPDKQARLSEAYARYRTGELDADDLPDLADIFPDDPLVRAQIGLQTEPGATAADALIQACGSCHNDVLDQTISRARFNIDLARLERSELDLAIERIERTQSLPGAMPPPEARQLAPDARARLLDCLRGSERASDFDAQLQHAATLGMASVGE